MKRSGNNTNSGVAEGPRRKDGVSLLSWIRRHSVVNADVFVGSQYCSGVSIVVVVVVVSVVMGRAYLVQLGYETSADRHVNSRLLLCKTGVGPGNQGTLQD